MKVNIIVFALQTIASAEDADDPSGGTDRGKTPFDILRVSEGNLCSARFGWYFAQTSNQGTVSVGSLSLRPGIQSFATDVTQVRDWVGGCGFT